MMGGVATSDRQADSAFDGISDAVARYYEAKVRRYGATPRGVDWECGPMQELRFIPLLKLFEGAASFSVTDLGCGYGALLPFMESRLPQSKITYVGLDLVDAMISRARRLHRGRPHASFHRMPGRVAATDYCVASGIFNVRLGTPLEAWERFVERTLREMNARGCKGFAFNLMAARGDGGATSLYRTAPARWAGVCEAISGGKVEVLDRYGMREFTLLVRKPGGAVPA